MVLWMEWVASMDVPAYSSKFEVLCHPDEERVVMEGEAWLRVRARESGLEDKGNGVEKLIASKLAHLSCQFWPHCSSAKLTLTLAKIMYWFYIFDDVMDEPSLLGSNVVACQQFCGLVLQAFFTMDSSKAVADLNMLPGSISCSLLMPTLALTVLVEWWAELSSGMSPRQRARFCSHFADYVLVHARQARFQEEEEVPGVEEYMRMRMVGGAIYVIEMLAEQACGIELDEEELRDPGVRRLNEVIGRHAGLLNDYVGFAKEYVRGEYLSLLPVLHYRNNVTLMKDADHLPPVPFQKACVEAWAIITSVEEECVACAKAVEEWAHTRTKSGLVKYVATLRSISAANWLFTAHSCRFTDFNKSCIQLPADADHDPRQSNPKPAGPTTRMILNSTGITV